MIPRNEPELKVVEGRLSGAKINAIPSPEPAEFGYCDILKVKLVSMDIFGHADTGWWYNTRPTSYIGTFVEPGNGSDVRLR